MTRTAATTPSAAKEEDRISWRERTPAELIAFILHRYHEPLRRDLPALVDRGRTIERAARTDALCPVGLGPHLEQMLLAVESHLQKEEKILFPLILAGRGAVAFMPIKVLMAEHDDHLASLRRLRHLTRDFALPAGAATDWRALYDDLAQLERELREHIDLENHLLFTRALTSSAPAT
jgi:regulator of cell morphogenesis and NO signaling